MNLMEKLVREVARVAVLRERYRNIGGGGAPGMVLMDRSLESAMKGRRQR